MDKQVDEVASTYDADGSWSITPPEDTADHLQNWAYWWNERSLPGDPAGGTAYLYMHTCKNIVCAGNDLPSLKIGDLVQLVQPNGVQTFQVVKDPEKFNKEGDNSTDQSEEVYSDHTGRLTIITCGYTGDVSDINWVITTQLVS